MARDYFVVQAPCLEAIAEKFSPLGAYFVAARQHGLQEMARFADRIVAVRLAL